MRRLASSLTDQKRSIGWCGLAGLLALPTVHGWFRRNTRAQDLSCTTPGCNARPGRSRTPPSPTVSTSLWVNPQSPFSSSQPTPESRSVLISSRFCSANDQFRRSFSESRTPLDVASSVPVPGRCARKSKGRVLKESDSNLIQF